jgi:hypothetical protein
LLGSVSLDIPEKTLASAEHSVVSGFLLRESREVGLTCMF